MNKWIKTVLISVFALSSFSFAQEEMTYEIWQQEIAAHKQREDDANAKIAVLEKDIADLKGQIADVRAQIKSKWEEMLAFVGVTQEEYDAFVAGLNDFISRVRGFESTYASDFSGWGKALKGADDELKVKKADKIAIFPRLDSKFAEADRAIADSRDALRLAKEASGTNSYTVRLIPERRDCLWRIAEYSEVYGDPFKWPSIYSANKDQIKDPDLIYPGQVFQIPR